MVLLILAACVIVAGPGSGGNAAGVSHPACAEGNDGPQDVGDRPLPLTGSFSCNPL